LQRDCNARWEIKLPDGSVTPSLHSGDYVEVCIDGNWIGTRVEHDGRDYYAVTQGVLLATGLAARMPK
jgi:hypothetical protein